MLNYTSRSENERQMHELLYTVVSLLVAELIAFVLGLLRRQRRQGHVSTVSSPVYRPGSGSNWLRKNAIRV